MFLFTVRFRLFALCLGLLIILGGANLLLGRMVGHQELQERQQQEQYRRVEIINSTLKAINSYRFQRGQINTATVVRDDVLLDQAKVAFSIAEKDLADSIGRLESFDPASAAVIRNGLKQLQAAAQGVVSAMVSGEKVQAKEYFAQATSAANAIQSALDAAFDREHKSARAARDQALENAHNAIFWSTSVIVGSGLISLGLAWVLLSSITRPLKKTVSALRQLNSGATEIDLPPITHDEFGDMAVALRQFREQAERLRRIAYRDPLTGLGNRANLEEALNTAVPEHAKLSRRLAMLYVDLDNFSAVNDSLGHSAGDRYLAEAAIRLQRFAPEEALVCRYSGDKFVVFVQDLGPTSGDAHGYLQDVGTQLLRGLSEPVPYGLHLLPMSVSIGVSQFPEDGETGEQLLSNADAAMYRAKQAGRNNVQFATPELAVSMRRRLAVATDVRRGIDNREFEPFYQPIVDTISRCVVGAEALVRWRHPARGVLNAYDFVEIAEATGSIRTIGEHCLKQCFAQSQAWAARGRPLRIAVNLSVRQIDDRSVLELLRTLALGTAAGTEGVGLDLEITESAMLEHLDRAQETLREIKQLGHRLSVDDFGTGYSSLTYVQRFPIDKIKIDRSFVVKVETSREAQAIITATVALAKSLELEVIAEGVETAQQADCLKALGCHFQQGFFYSPALPAKDFEVWVDAFSLREQRA